MVNAHLEEQQIKQLVDFIKAKRFFDPPVVVEILDHLACKVEEVMTATPALTFEEAVQKAYKSFGVMGFRPIEDAYQRIVRKKYRKLYWQKVRTIFTDMKLLPLIILAAWLAYKCWTWSRISDTTGPLGENLFQDIFLSGCFAGTLANSLPFRKNEFLKSTLSSSIPYMGGWVWWCWMLPPHHPANIAHGAAFYTGGVFAALLTVVSITFFIADRYTRKLAFNEYLENYKYIDVLKQ